MIREQAPGARAWKTKLGSRGETTEDFAIVARLLDSKTGQFTVATAGIGPNGTRQQGNSLRIPNILKKVCAMLPQTGKPRIWKLFCRQQ